MKRAFLVGINYIGTDYELSGCINDVNNLSEFLKTKEYDVEVMTDHSTIKPTRNNILAKFQEIVNWTNNNKNISIDLWISYSGHGYHIKDLNGDEKDGRDEILCTIDNKDIVDDEICNFINKLSSNVNLFMLMDCCHSGTIVDLKYDYAVDSFGSCHFCEFVDDSKCQVVMISGCKDTQTSADAHIDNQFQGAMTSSFLNSIHRSDSYQELILKMRNYLHNGNYEQIPQLSSGKLIKIKSEIKL